MKTLQSITNKAIALGVVALLFSCSDPNKPQIVEEYNPDGTIKSQTPMVKGLRNGMVKTYDERGRLEATADYVDDLREGKVCQYNPANGKLTAMATYKKDVQEGPSTLHYTSGAIYREMLYREGRLDSIVKTYYPSGKLQAENKFKMGQASINLKEYDEKGNIITDYPQIVLKTEDMRASRGMYRLKFSLSDGNKKAEFYSTELIDGEYLSEKAQKLDGKDGVGFYTYNLPRGTAFSEKYVVYVKYRTDLGNTKVDKKVFSINIR
jgi:antitoxin component YwqK of YwqJK toxin-antitoxin module